jgi:hypothetical protein
VRCKVVRKIFRFVQCQAPQVPRELSRLPSRRHNFDDLNFHSNSFSVQPRDHIHGTIWRDSFGSRFINIYTKRTFQFKASYLYVGGSKIERIWGRVISCEVHVGLHQTTFNIMSNNLHGVMTRSTVKADSHIACRAHAVPRPCRAANGLECVFHIWFTQCGRVWFTLVMQRPCHALTMPFFSRPRHSTAVERRPVGYQPAFGFFRLPCGVPRRLLSEAYQSQIQMASVKPNNVCHDEEKSGSGTLQKRRSVKLLD